MSPPCDNNEAMNLKTKAKMVKCYYDDTFQRFLESFTKCQVN